MGEKKAVDTYLNDHLGGAMLGSDLAEQIRDHAEGSALGTVMAELAAEIEADRQTLIELMDEMDTNRNPVKQATGWLAEKASRVKFSGAGSGDAESGTFMALESLRLGVAGKKCLWISLNEVRDEYEPLQRLDFERLIERAESQEQTLERERRIAGLQAMSSKGASSE